MDAGREVKGDNTSSTIDRGFDTVVASNFEQVQVNLEERRGRRKEGKRNKSESSVRFPLPLHPLAMLVALPLQFSDIYMCFLSHIIDFYIIEENYKTDYEGSVLSDAQDKL